MGASTQQLLIFSQMITDDQLSKPVPNMVSSPRCFNNMQSIVEEKGEDIRNIPIRLCAVKGRSGTARLLFLVVRSEKCERKPQRGCVND